MTAPTIDPQQALEKMEDEDYAYIDVRTVLEFDAGHPEGAYNVPWLIQMPGSKVPNDAFLAVMKKTFPLDAKLIVGCQAGGRSAKAAAALVDAGFTGVLDQCAGYGGRKGAFGQTEEAGWQASGLPVAIEAEDGRSWAALSEAEGGSK